MKKSWVMEAVEEASFSICPLTHAGNCVIGKVLFLLPGSRKAQSQQLASTATLMVSSAISFAS